MIRSKGQGLQKGKNPLNSGEANRLFEGEVTRMSRKGHTKRKKRSAWWFTVTEERPGVH